MYSFFNDELCFSALSTATLHCGVRPQSNIASSVSVLLQWSILARALMSSLLISMLSFFNDELYFSALSIATLHCGVRPQSDTLSSVSVLLQWSIPAIAKPTHPSYVVMGDGDGGSNSGSEGECDVVVCAGSVDGIDGGNTGGNCVWDECPILHRSLFPLMCSVFKALFFSSALKMLAAPTLVISFLLMSSVSTE